MSALTRSVRTAFLPPFLLGSPFLLEKLCDTRLRTGRFCVDDFNATVPVFDHQIHRHGQLLPHPWWLLVEIIIDRRCYEYNAVRCKEVFGIFPHICHVAAQHFIILVAPRNDRIVFIVGRNAVVQKMHVQAVHAYVSRAPLAPKMTFRLVPVSTLIGGTKRHGTFSALMDVTDTALAEDGRAHVARNDCVFPGTNASFAY